MRFIYLFILFVPFSTEDSPTVPRRITIQWKLNDINGPSSDCSSLCSTAVERKHSFRFSPKLVKQVLWGPNDSPEMKYKRGIRKSVCRYI
jgi:hypothetical protein